MFNEYPGGTAAALDSVVRNKFGRTIMNTAYSGIRLAPINTAEHYHLAAHLGFNALKGDVRITSDGQLVMCHDWGFTLDENGRIGPYNRNNDIKILDMTFRQVMALEYAADFDVMGHYARVCTFDTFVRICKEQGMICYATLRNDRIPEVVRGVLDTLRKYHMTEHCVINSFTLETLREVRKYNRTITLSQVYDHRKPITVENVENVTALGNAMLTGFLYPAENGLELWEQSREAVELAARRDIPIHMAQVSEYSDYCDMIRRGVQGFHITRAFLPYTRTDVHFAFRVAAGKGTFENLLLSSRLAADVETTGNLHRISNIRCVGSGYGYDDGLPALWMNRLPYSLEVSCPSHPTAHIRWDGTALVLDTAGIDGLYTVHVSL